MNKLSNPKTVHAPLGAYHHTATVPAGSDWLVIAGQVGIAPDGSVPDDIRGQAEQAFRNVLECVREAGMGPEHIVKLTTFLTDARFIGEYRAARSAIIGDDVKPTSTMLIVVGLAAPEYFIEVEAWAAKS